MNPTEQNDKALRPQTLDDFVGQNELKENLQIAIRAAMQRGQALDHILLYGPPGLGKTTISNIIANELHSRCHSTVAPAIKTQHDLTMMLLRLQSRDVFMVDEIHRLPIELEEVLYSSLEDYRLDLIVGSGGAGKNFATLLSPFTFVGATTLPGLISAPLRSRFSLSLQLQPYSVDELQTIVERSAGKLDISIQPEAAHELAGRCRGTPRIANNLLRRARDIAQLQESDVTLPVVEETLQRMGIDANGVTEQDRRLLRTVIERFRGGPVGLKALAAALAEDPDSIEQVIEPYLIQTGYLDRSHRGRMATDLAYKHLGLSKLDTTVVVGC